MKTIKRIFQMQLSQREMKKLKRIMAIVMIPMFILQMCSFNLLLMNVAVAEDGSIAVAENMAPESPEASEPAEESDEKPAPVIAPAPVAEPVLVEDPALAVDPADSPQAENEGIIDPEVPVIVVPDPAAETPTEVPVEEVVPTVPAVETPEEEKTCLADDAEIKTSEEADWEVDGDVAKTKEDVKLGVKYEFPGNKDVSVTFSCLPKETSKLKINQIKVEDINLPEGVNPATEFAYDITTGMENGDFEYDITLPKPEGMEAEVSYIEKSINEAKQQVEADEVKIVEEEDDIKVDKNSNGDKVKISGLEHFTIFIVTSPGPTISTAMVDGEPYVSVPPSTNVTVTLSVTTSESGDNNDWESSQYSINGIDWICVNTPDHSSSGTYKEDFTITAPAAVGSYNLSLRVYNGSNCTGGVSSPDLVLDDAIRVVTPLPSLTPPTLVNDPSDPVALTSVSGIWTDIDGGSGYEGINSNEIRWGSPAGSQKSGLRFTNSGNQSFDTGDPFYLGMLTHMNWPTYAGTAADQATIQITLNFDRPDIPNVVLDYDFDIEETSNSTGNCKIYQRTLTPCDDRVTFPNSYGTQVFTIGDIQYTLVIDGFVDAYPSGNPVDAFVTEEQKDNSAFLVGHLSSVLVEKPEIRLTKKTNDQDVTASPGPNLYIGDTVEWKYIVQNSGNVALAGIALSDSDLGPITCPSTELAKGVTMNCIATGTVIEGQYENTATVNGTTPSSSVVTASDSSWYYGLEKGSIKIIKDSVPNSDQDFNFTSLNNSLGSFTLDDDGDNGNTYKNEIVFGNLPQGEHQITETPVAGWNPHITCVNDDRWSSNGSTAIVHVVPGEEVVCTFTNTLQTGTLTVIKKVTNDNGGTKTVGDFGINFSSGALTFDGGVGSGDTKTYTSQAMTLTAGNYTLSENDSEGYTEGTWDCGTISNGGKNTSIDLAAGQNMTCSITNDDQAGTLIVKKVVVNDNGGTKTASDFAFSVGGTAVAFEADGQNDLTVDAGTYNITEPAVSGYSTTYDNCSGVVVPNGGTATCTITNNDIAPALTLIKEVINNNGGIPDASAWTLTATGPTGFSGTGPSVSNGDSFDAGSYTLSESGPGGYLQGDWLCIGNGEQTGNSIALDLGESATCTVINDDIAPSLTLVKHVINDNGGTAEASAWTLSASGTTGFSGAGPSIASNSNFVAGTYTLSESGGPNGYTASSWNCVGGTQDGSNITVGIGQTATCTITNDDKSPRLIVRKLVINDNGGGREPYDFTINVTGSNVSVPLFPGGTSQVTLDAGTPYNVWETDVSDTYSVSYSPDCSGTLSLNEEKTCLITNDDIQPKLTVTKIVVGSNATPGDFDIYVGKSGIQPVEVVSGVQTGFNAGTYYVTEAAPGYTTVISGDCSPDNGSITINIGDIKSCTVTNTRDTGTIIVKKVMAGGTDTFNYTGSPSGSISNDNGTIQATVDTGQYTSTEEAKNGWDLTNITCDDTNPPVGGKSTGDISTRTATFNVEAGETVTCTFTNTKFGSISGMKWEDMDGDGSKDAEDLGIAGWTINLDKDADGTIDQTTTTDVSGNYSFGNLLPGNYKVLENTPSPWNVSYPSAGVNYYTGINLTAGANLTGYDFGNSENGQIKGYKWEDIDGDGNKEDGEGVPASQWQIKLWKEVNGIPVDQDGSVYTDPATGAFSFGVSPGTYYLSEVLQSGWAQTWPDGSLLAPDGVTRLLGPIVVTSGLISENNNFGNFNDVSIKVCKQEDRDGNINSDDDRTNVQGWSMTLYDDAIQVGSSHTTGTDGCYTWTNLGPGNYSVSEETRSDWTNLNSTSYGFGVIESGDTSKSWTFVNSRLGKVIVEKVMVGGTDSFDFTGDVNGTINANNGTLELNNVIPGSDPISEESIKTGWTLTDISCEGGRSMGPGLIELDNRRVIFRVESGETVTCTFTNTKLPTLTVVKDLYPVGHGAFDLMIDNTVYATNVGDGGTTGAQIMSIGTHQISEKAGNPHTNISDYSVAYGGDCSETGVIILAAGENKTCTITNTAYGTIGITKDSSPDSDQDFSFTTSGKGLSGFSLDDDSDSMLSNVQYFYHLLPGQYGVTETGVSGWELTGLNCNDTSNTTTDLATATASINLDPGESVYCTFNNTQLGKITVEKQTLPDGSSQSFEFDLSWSDVNFNLTDGQQETSDWLAPGQYSVSEIVPTGWDLTNITCIDPNQNSGQNPTGATGASIILEAGETVTCTFTNTKIPTLTVTKYISPINDPGLFNLFIDGNQIATNIGNNHTSNPLRVDIGYNHLVTETAGTDTNLDDYNAVFGGDCDSTGHIVLAAGEDRNCTITNTRKILPLYVSKFEDLNNNQTRDVEEDYLDGWTMELYDNETCSGTPLSSLITDSATSFPGTAKFENLYQGKTYWVKEIEQNGWTLTTGNCRGYTIHDDINSNNQLDFGNQQVSDVNVCKEDNEGNKLPDWEMILAKGPVDGPKAINISDGNGTDSTDLPAGEYLIKVSGTYRYGNSQMNADAGFSYRPMNIPAGCDCWKSGFDLPSGSNGLMALINDNAVGWGLYNSSHEYSYLYNHTGGSINISIWDDYYGDNINDNNFQFEIYEIERKGTTGNYGCVMFEDVPFGDYYLDEILKEYWLRNSGTGLVTVDGEETFTVVNEDNTPGSITGAKWEDKNGNGEWNGDEYKLSGWEIQLKHNGQKIESAVTDNQGFEFSNLLPGNYEVCEVNQDGWKQTFPVDNQCHSVSVLAGRETDYIFFGNQRKPVKIEASKIVCTDERDLPDWGNGGPNITSATATDWIESHESCSLESGWEFQWGDDSAFNPGDDHVGPAAGWNDFDTTTNAEGVASVNIFNIDNISQIKVRESLKEGYLPFSYTTNNYSNSDDVTAELYCDTDVVNYDNDDRFSPQYDKTYYCVAWNVQLADVAVVKFDDLNGDGQKNDNEGTLSGWEINLSGQDSVNTNENGQVAFDKLLPGSYGLSETLQPGWNQTNIYCEDSGPGVLITSQGEAYGHHGNCAGWNGCGNAETCAQWACEVNGYNNLVSYGDQRPCTEFNDCNLFNSQGSIDMNWHTRPDCPVMGVTDIVCSDSATLARAALIEDDSEASLVADNDYQLELNAGDSKTCYIGNQFITPELTIEKFNSQWPNIQEQGDVIDYTITVRASKNNVNGVMVTDLPPEGFEYLEGSWAASSSLGAAHDGNLQLSHAYASPGTWDLGNMQADEEIVLTYKAQISSGQQPGIYNDLAWAGGTDNRSTIVLATSVPAPADDLGVITDNFVGTQIKLAAEITPQNVELDQNTETKTKTRTRYLPATGSSTWWIGLAVALLVAGAGLMIFSRKKKGNINDSKNMTSKIATLVLMGTGIAFLSFGNYAEAAIAPNIRLEQPDTPTNITDLNIGFVVLDIDNNTMTVVCEKQGPSDGGFIPFQTVNINTEQGGNSGTCDFIMPSDGSYDFRATVTSDNGSDTSDLVTVVLNSNAPSTPLNYDRDGDSCNLTFTTANDGLTAKVELYRSKENEFTADASTRVTEVVIGPNENGSLNDTFGNCDDYLYAIRAVSAAGIGSGFVGDEEVNVRTRTRTRTVTEETVIRTGGAIPVAAGTEGTVAGEETTNPEAVNQEEGQGEGTVLGEETETNEKPGSIAGFAKKYWPWALLLIAGGLIWYGFVKRKKNDQSAE